MSYWPVPLDFANPLTESPIATTGFRLLWHVPTAAGASSVQGDAAVLALRPTRTPILLQHSATSHIWTSL